METDAGAAAAQNGAEKNKTRGMDMVDPTLPQSLSASQGNPSASSTSGDPQGHSQEGQARGVGVAGASDSSSQQDAADAASGKTGTPQTKSETEKEDQNLSTFHDDKERHKIAPTSPGETTSTSEPSSVQDENQKNERLPKTNAQNDEEVDKQMPGGINQERDSDTNPEIKNAQKRDHTELLGEAKQNAPKAGKPIETESDQGMVVKDVPNSDPDASKRERDTCYQAEHKKKAETEDTKKETCKEVTPMYGEKETREPKDGPKIEDHQTHALNECKEATPMYGEKETREPKDGPKIEDHQTHALNECVENTKQGDNAKEKLTDVLQPHDPENTQEHADDGKKETYTEAKQQGSETPNEKSERRRSSILDTRSPRKSSSFDSSVNLTSPSANKGAAAAAKKLIRDQNSASPKMRKDVDDSQM